MIETPLLHPTKKGLAQGITPLASPFILMFCLQILTSTSSRSSYPWYLLQAPRTRH